jgi:glycosyltransferase involved in cell wall biosynthesis
MSASTPIYAVSMFKDEADIAYDSIRHLVSEGVDGIIVADNNSTDGTWAELEKAAAHFSCDIQLIHDPEVGYYQSRKMTDLARMAAGRGAQWIIPFDADEIWHGDVPLGQLLAIQPDDVTVAEATLWNYYRTVAFRWNENAVVQQGNHGVDGVEGLRLPLLNVRHFPYRSFRHFVKKARNGARAYAATDLPDYQGAHWRGYGSILENGGEDALREVFDTYFSFATPSEAGLVRDPAPFCRW